ncbi:hypothetical protein [Planomonospora venezuelensis]|uniref:Tetratricopeptide (TPR) repeat protein n=1 Tax=Planomonospora venezuelensis TaxID=1999 RepID=A0A841D9C9_PLAVE|nr:hypothetical protein [Planomonospora venezuelensis]MBB5965217.1 tetratricopeptide (TPR) repeat protein [Planomonospora venezuelensis]GIN00298.1 hypothetical protein Pve01_19560 [Planomonospora venezuelensis]
MTAAVDRRSLVLVRGRTDDGRESPRICRSCADGFLPHREAASTAPGDGIGPLLLDGVRARCADGDLRSSREHFEAAYRAAENGDDGPAAASAVLGLSGLWVHEHRGMTAGASIEARLRHALTMVDPRSPLALRLRVRLAAEADYRSGGHAAVVAMLEEARRAGDPTARAEAASLAHQCLLGPGQSETRHELARELIAASFRTSCRGDLLMGLLWRTLDHVLDADPHAERHLAELRGLLARQDHLAVGFVVRAIEVMLGIRAGRLAQAEAEAAACAEQGVRAGDPDAANWYGAQLVAIRWYQGRIAELAPMLAEAVNSPELSAVDNAYLAALAVAAATAGDRRQAAGALARLRGRDLALLPRSSTWLAAMFGIVETAHLLGDAETSAAAYELLGPFARLPMVVSLGVACFGSARHSLGVAALTMGDAQRAVGHLQAAVRDNLAMGHWPAAALSRMRWAQALVLRAGDGDAAEAGRQLEAAMREAAELGMVLPAGREVHVAVTAAGSGGRRPLVGCRREGRRWTVGLGRRSVQVEHSLGMAYLATLLANPRYEIPAVELAAGPVPHNEAVVAAGAGTAQRALDEEAVRAYRRRLSLLQEELDEHEAANDIARAEQVRAERDWLIDELASATGLAGRARNFTDNEERARVSVGKAIRRAVARIAAADPIIGEELRTTIRTGRLCCYQPNR